MSIIMSYKQLIEGQRYQIEAYLHEGFSYRDINKRLKVSHSRIGREVRRNRIRKNHYLPEVAQAKTMKRRCQAAKYGIPVLTMNLVKFGLSQKWSPEQIAGVGKILGHPVSHEWVYGYVQQDKLRGGKLYKQLRHAYQT
jgi:IS30 family transposase